MRGYRRLGAKSDRPARNQPMEAARRRQFELVLLLPKQLDISHTETWGIALHNALNVRFDDGKVAWTKHFDPNPPQASGGCGGLAPSEKPKSGWQKFSDGVNGHQPSYVGRRQQAQAEEQRWQRAQIAEQQRANCLQQIENERLQRQIDELRKQQTKEPVKRSPEELRSASKGRAGCDRSGVKS